jgi:peptidoglycan hydrolase CwlO-like protein
MKKYNFVLTVSVLINFILVLIIFSSVADVKSDVNRALDFTYDNRSTINNLPNSSDSLSDLEYGFDSLDGKIDDLEDQASYLESQYLYLDSQILYLQTQLY